jgi:hypothetical protein
MKKLSIATVLSVMLLCTSAANASLSVGDYISVDNTAAGTLGTGSGGEFLASYGPNVNSLTSTFLTFCVEDAQLISLGTPYQVNSIIDRAVTGPTGTDGTYGGLPADILERTTAWLFLQFDKVRNQGVAADAGFSYSTDTDANDLQAAIWWLESSGAAGANNAYVTLANAQLSGVLDAAKAIVRVINPVIVGTDGTHEADHVQSMLYVVPEASTIAVWSVLSLVGAGVAYRRKIQK